MRASDAVLVGDLLESGLPHLAARAERGEWNEFFGPHATRHHLIETLRCEIRIANVVRKRLIQNVIDGRYDATQEEADEWEASPKVQEAFAGRHRDG